MRRGLPRRRRRLRRPTERTPAPPKPTLANMINLMTKPRWCLGMLGTRRRQFGNIIGHVKSVDNMGSLSDWTPKQFDPRLNWGDVEWIKKRWGGTLIGRAFLYGLGAMGEAGVTKCLAIIHKELELTMAFGARGDRWKSSDASSSQLPVSSSRASSGFRTTLPILLRSEARRGEGKSFKTLVRDPRGTR